MYTNLVEEARVKFEKYLHIVGTVSTNWTWQRYENPCSSSSCLFVCWKTWMRKSVITSWISRDDIFPTGPYLRTISFLIILSRIGASTVRSTSVYGELNSADFACLTRPCFSRISPPEYSCMGTAYPQRNFRERSSSKISPSVSKRFCRC